MKSQRLCWRGYATILRALQQKPHTSGEVIALMGCTGNSARRILNRMHDLGLVHIDRWEKCKPKASPQALWAFGKGEDAPWPEGASRPGFARTSRARYLTRPELISFAHMVRALDEPTTRAELCALSGATSANVSRLMIHCKAIGLVRVAAWDTSKTGKPAECLQIGGGRSAPRPAPMTREQINRRSRMARTAKDQARAITSALTASMVSAALEPAELEAA